MLKLFLLAFCATPFAAQQPDLEAPLLKEVELTVGFSKRLIPKGVGIDPIANVQVRVFHAESPRVTLAEGKSDATGKLTVKVPSDLLEIVKGRRTEVLCEPIHKGYMRKPRAIHASVIEAVPPWSVWPKDPAASSSQREIGST